MNAPPSPPALACLLLAGRVVTTEAAPLRGPELWALLDRVPDPGALLGRSAAEVATLAGSTTSGAERLARLLEPVAALTRALEHLRSKGITTLAPVDPAYPPRLRQRLGHLAPAVLHIVGPAALLAGGGVGIVGSRRVSAQGAGVARGAGRAVARRGRAVISGAAPGVDQLAMASAWAGDGRVIGVIAVPLGQALSRGSLAKAVSAGEGCACTPASPDTAFTPARALARNKVIYGLADFTLVVASEAGSGGTWAGATESLRRGWGPVAVWRGPGQGPGNRALERLGAHPVLTDDGLASLDGLPLPRGRDRAEQLGLALSSPTAAGGC